VNLEKQHVIKLIGYASGIAANNIDCALGPWHMYYHQDLFNTLGFQVEWETIVKASTTQKGINVMPLVIKIVTELGLAVMPLAKNNEPFCVFGGDHSSAMGTWSAVAHANRHRGDIGLIWIDAHMDCHTPNTSETQNIHGMPLAHLLGEGNSDLTHLFDHMPAIKPENLCLVGIRSYEPEEKKILNRLGINIFQMDAINQHGLPDILEKAYAITSQSTCGVGISLDLDAIDPQDAPGVGCSAEHGIRASTLVPALEAMVSNRDFLGLEIVEYNPILDINEKTINLIMALFNAVYKKYSGLNKTLDSYQNPSSLQGLVM
jgi:arginase